MYVRVSTQDQYPENQIIQLKQHLVIRDDMELFDIYEDKISGIKDVRPELDRLMQDARMHKFNHVLIWKVSRLGRSALHMFQIVEEWKKLGIGFSISTLNIDTSTPMGRFVFGLMAQVAELDRENIRDATRAGMDRMKKEIAEQGFHVKKDGTKVTSIGRPKGSKDKTQRRKSGYYMRWHKQPK